LGLLLKIKCAVGSWTEEALMWAVRGKVKEEGGRHASERFWTKK
jgi:hypothetical protein